MTQTPTNRSLHKNHWLIATYGKCGMGNGPGDRKELGEESTCSVGGHQHQFS